METSIDPKRPQEMKNNDFEEYITRRREKKDNKDDKKRVDLGVTIIWWLPKRFECVRPGGDPKESERNVS